MRLEIAGEVKYFGRIDEDNSFVFSQYPGNVKCRVPGNVILNAKISRDFEALFAIILERFGALDIPILTKIEGFILSSRLNDKIHHITQSESDSLNLKVEGDCVEILAFYDHDDIMVPFRLDAASLDFLITKLQDARNGIKN